MTPDPWESYFSVIHMILTFSSPEDVEVENYNRLLWTLYQTTFVAQMEMDKNRIADALSFRRSFGYDDLVEPASVLEVMVALARRLEVDVMRGTSPNDRTGVWFWNMISSLGLYHMTDAFYDETEVGRILRRFLRRRYSPDGRGGLFTVPTAKRDLRNEEIWYQAGLYLTDILRFEGFIEPERG